MYLMAVQHNVPLPMSGIAYFATNHSLNSVSYSNSQFDNYLTLARQLNSICSQFFAYVRKAEEIAIITDPVVIPLFYLYTHNLINLDRWAGWYPNAFNRHPWVGIRPR